MAGILDGIRIIDWTLFQVGPYATAMLADQGAEVIHIEERGKGDPLRGLAGVGHGMPTYFPQAPHRHIHFEEHNRNKKSLALDLKKAGGREIIYRLVQKSDIFLTNFRTQAVDRLGLDYETLKKHNPNLIYASATGVGTRGPDKDTPSLDSVANARSGITMACGERDQPPTRMVSGLGDRIASVFLAYGVVSALLARWRYGKGQEVKVSQLGSLIALYGFTIMPCITLDKDYARPRRSELSNPLNNNYYRCQDGRWLVLALAQSERYWIDFCRALGRSDLEHDPRFDSLESRKQNCTALVAVLDELFASRPYPEWEKALRQADMPFGPVNSVIDLKSDPQVLENGYIRTWEHPSLGPIPFVGFPVEFSENPATLRDPAPEVGQHNEEILLDIGYGWEDIAQLKESEVI